MRNITFLSSKMFGAYDSCSSTLNVLNNKRMTGTCEIASHQSLSVRHRNGTYRKTKDLTRNFQGGGCKDTAQLPLQHIQNVGALCLHTLVAIHEIVWGENDAVLLINTFIGEREQDFCKYLKSSVQCRLSWL
jgi:hypothetical protein